MAIIELSVVPIGTGTTSLSNYVAGAVKVLREEENIKYELTAMGTIIEGELERLLAIAKRMHQSAFDAGAMRVVTTVKIDDRRDKTSSISGKMASVKQKLE
ncbi:MTH1187 family thiamine-binding protein [Chloroflexota bacterium]